jgi:hypothetical protein
MLKRPLFIIIGIVALVFTFTSPVAAIKRWLASASDAKSAYAFTPAEIGKRLKKIEATLPAIEQLIAERRYQDGRELFDTTFYALRRSQVVSGDTALGEGRTLGGELNLLEGRVGKAAREDFESLVAKIAQGGTDTATVHRLMRSFSAVGGNNLAGDLAARSAGLDKIRRPLATRWVRLDIDAPNDDYQSIIVAHMLKTLVLPPGFTVVFGPPVGPAEDEATFSTLSFKTAIGVQDYLVQARPDPARAQDNSFYHDRTSDGLLEGVMLEIKVRNAFAAYTTSWSELPGKAGDTLYINLKIPTPASFEFKVGPGHTAHDEFKERNVVRIAEMKTKLTAALAALPPLDFVPEKNSPPPLSRRSALFQAAAFTDAASASLAAKKSVGEIACIAVELMIEPLADRIEPLLDQLTVVERTQLAHALAVRPWYHGFNPLANLIVTAPAESVPPILAAMKRDLDQAALMQPALARVLREKDPREQGRMMGLLVGHSPASALPDFVRLYPTLGAVPQSAILTSLVSRDRAMAGRFAQQLIESGKPAVVLQVTEAMKSALSAINSGRKMDLTSDEIAVFTQAIAATRGAPREQIIEKLPSSEDLLAQLLRSDRASWTDAENLALYQCCNGPLPYNASREAEIMGQVFKLVKAGRLNTPQLAQKATRVLSPIANNLLRTRGDEQVKIPLILQVIDERSRPASEICAQSIVAMVVSLQAPGVLAHPDARTLLIKGKAYGSETNWAKFMDPQTMLIYGKDYPGEKVRTKIRELTTEAAKTDPGYGDLL